MRHQAFVIEAEAEAGIQAAQTYAEKELGMQARANPDFVVLNYGLFSVADARRVSEVAAQTGAGGEHKVVVIAASRAYHEAQNALLKIFEEPPPGTYLFFILPTLGGLLPTLRSRVSVLDARAGEQGAPVPEAAQQFLKATQEKRSALIKKLASGKDEEERREHRDEAVAIVNGVEAAAYEKFKERGGGAAAPLLSDIAVLRGYLYDRSAPVRLILEHLSLVLPKDLL